jgi:hypothetical protein
VPRCAAQDVEAFALEVGKLEAEWNDVWRIAETTPGTARAPLALKLQEMRSRMAGLPYPQCLSAYYQYELDGMDSAIETCRVRMALSEVKWAANQYSSRSSDAFRMARRTLERIRSGEVAPLDCPAEEYVQVVDQTDDVLKALVRYQQGPPEGHNHGLERLEVMTKAMTDPLPPGMTRDEYWWQEVGKPLEWQVSPLAELEAIHERLLTMKESVDRFPSCPLSAFVEDVDQLAGATRELYFYGERYDPSDPYCVTTNPLTQCSTEGIRVHILTVIVQQRRAELRAELCVVRENC